MRTGAEVIVDELMRQGVDVVFGYPGGAVLDLYDALYAQRERLTHIRTAHEQGAIHAADGYARVSGRTGVVVATSGPGATNLVTGLANALLDSVPIVAITGNVAIPYLGRDSFQEVDIVGITQSVVKHSYMAADVQTLPEILREAFAIAGSGRKGPVLIDVPKSVQAAVYEAAHRGEARGDISLERLSRRQGDSDFRDDASGYVGDCDQSMEATLEAAVELISGSERPLIYCGGGVLASGASELVRAISERMDAPVVSSLMGLTAIPASHPNHLGMCGMHGKYAASRAQSECDVLLAVGVRFSDRATGDRLRYAERCRVIHIDIDVGEINKNIPATVALCGDAATMLRAILKRLPQQTHTGWQQSVQSYRTAGKQYADQLDSAADASALTPRRIFEVLRAYLGPDALLATDVGQHQMWTTLYYAFERPGTLITSGGLGTMGYGMGAAIGGCMARGRQLTALITSEGSFGMNLNELATAVREHLPLVIVILNNGALGMVRQWQTLFYEARYSETTLPQTTDFKTLAEAFGAEGHTLTSPRHLEEVLSAYISSLPGMSRGPILLNCIIDPDEGVYPMIPPGTSIEQMKVR